VTGSTSRDRTIELALESGIATVTISHLSRRNAMTLAMWERLGSLLRELDADPNTRVVVLRGDGARSFSAGADITEFEELRSTPERAAEYNARVAEALDALVELSKPVVAMVFGHCIGGGCELAVACDLRIAAQDAVFGIPAARRGISLAYDDIKRLVDLVGPSGTKLMLFTGDAAIPAQQAREMGLVDQVVSADELETHTYGLAGQIAANAPSTIRWTKQAIRVVLRDPALATVPGRDAQTAQLFGTADFREGVIAFLEKRPPRFDWGQG
jgi:enoyl-CoA hydratase/carnithine racemase